MSESNPCLSLSGVGAALVAALLLSSCAKPAAVSETRVVGTAPVLRADLTNSMTLQAEFEPFQAILLHGKVAGYVSSIRVDIGDRVKAGELIATLEVPELRDQLEGARAAEKKAQADFDIVRLNAERMAGVNKTQPGLIAQQDLDEIVSKQAAAEATFATAKAEADRYQALSDYTRITAPFAGVITKRFADLGSLIQAGTSASSEAVVELVEDSRLRLRFPVPEAVSGDLKKGESVQIEVPSLSRKFTGKVIRDSWAIDRSTRTLLTEVDVKNDDGSIKAGMYASVTLPLEEARGALAVPVQAISVGDHPSVWVVTAAGTAQEQPVTVGLKTADQAEIKSGLSGGERVIVSDRGGLHSGDSVTAKDLSTSAQN